MPESGAVSSMLIRIRLPRGRPIEARLGKNRQLAAVLGGILTPASVTAFLMGFWRIAADLSYASAFAIDEGLFSHWHTWIILAFTLAYCASRLKRYASRYPSWQSSQCFRSKPPA
jgi:hypothetical protein